MVAPAVCWPVTKRHCSRAHFAVRKILLYEAPGAACASTPGTIFIVTPSGDVHDLCSRMDFLSFFFHPIYYLRPSILSLLVVTQIRGHIAGSSPPLPTTVRGLHFCREKISALSSLVDSRRIVLTHARRSQQLSLFFYIRK